MNLTAITIALIIVVPLFILGIMAILVVLGAAKYEKEREEAERLELQAMREQFSAEHKARVEKIQKVRDEMERGKNEIGGDI